MGQPVTDGWVSINFGISLLRTNNFHGNVLMEGENKSNSALESFKESAGNVHPADLNSFSYGALAYDAYLINFDEDSGEYYTIIDPNVDTNFMMVSQNSLLYVYPMVGTITDPPR